MSDNWVPLAHKGTSKYTHPQFPDWAIYEIPAGYMVWRRLHFFGKYASFIEARLAVEDEMDGVS